MSRENLTQERPKRQYQMKRRAELEEQTRLRITESTVALHEKVGPARTSISAVAELAGVRRSTVYRHFPDEESLIDACSAHWRAANPAPDLAAWAAIADPPERLRMALAEMYAHYRRTERMRISLMRDESLVPAIREKLQGWHSYLDAAADVLAGKRAPKGRRATVGHALAFTTWHSLAREQGLADDDVVTLMSQLVEASSA
jgi:AcrR family transcriptional regulator